MSSARLSTAAPAAATHGDVVTVTTPDAADVVDACLIRPHAVTHHTDAGHRRIRIPVVATAAGSVDVQTPASAAIAPPGWYILFLFNGAGSHLLPTG
jgi:hypothetical protein